MCHVQMYLHTSTSFFVCLCTDAINRYISAQVKEILYKCIYVCVHTCSLQIYLHTCTRHLNLQAVFPNICAHMCGLSARASLVWRRLIAVSVAVYRHIGGKEERRAARHHSHDESVADVWRANGVSRGQVQKHQRGCEGGERFATCCSFLQALEVR